MFIKLTVLAVILSAGFAYAKGKGQATGKPAIRVVNNDTGLIQKEKAQPAAEHKQAQTGLPPADLLFGDSIRIPYQSGKVYRMKVTPGCPVAIWLPEGEMFRNMYINTDYFTAESKRNSRVGIVQALPATGVLGKTTTLTCETEPLGLNPVFVVEVVDRIEANAMAPSWNFYLAGTDTTIAARRAVLQEMHEKDVASKEAEAKEMEARVIASIGRLRTTYKYPSAIKKVVDDGVQTFIYMPDSQEQGAVKIQTKNGDEIPTFKFDNGTYRIFRTLQEKEKFVIEVGKTKHTVKLS